MARGNPYRFARFGRGLNTTDGAYSLREGYEDDPSGLGSECRNCLNVVSRRRGNISRRNGSVSIGTIATSPRTVISTSVIGQDDASFALSVTTEGELYSLLATASTHTSLKTGLSTSAPWDWLEAPGTGGPAFGMNGTDTPQKSTGAVTADWVASVGAVPNGTMMAYHDNRVWVSGKASAPNRVYWSNVGDPVDWPAANFNDFEASHGTPVRGLATLGPYVLVLKERGLWVIYDSDTGANRKIADHTGTVGAKTVAVGEQGCFYLDPQLGVMLTDGAEVKTISAQIQDTLDDVSYADKQNACGAYLNGHYYLSIKIAGVQYVYDYDAQLGSWWRHSTAVSTLDTWDRGSGLFLVGASLYSSPSTVVSGRIMQLYKDGLTKDQNYAFESYWQGPYHAFGSPHLRKRCREVHLDGQGVVDVYTATDYDVTKGTYEKAADFAGTATAFGGAESFGGAGYFGGSITIGEDSVYTQGVGRAWSLSVYSAASSYWEMDAYTMLMNTRKD